MRTRIRVRMDEVDIIMRDVISEYVIDKILERMFVMLTLFPFPPYHEFRDGRFHTDEGSHFATVEVMNNRKRAIIVTMGDKREVLADTSADLYRMVRGCLIR